DSDIDENCLYEYANDSDKEIDEDVFEDDNDIIVADVSKEKRRTKPRMTKYERVRLISDRTKQLAGGAKPMIKNVSHLDPKEVALLELEKNLMPLIIERPLPDGSKEKWYTYELAH